eukprot:TRINITY_DN834_c1_g2_i2.p1 TRINITY_DN834_c1_g2~~TRINITY_DN834_c1_g2_i2.p1  ORF type:complete len:256 (+),score=93.43 TRINITY_DN834_c1_g2_i2:117-884(+)
MGKGGSSKGAASTAVVAKPWLKKKAATVAAAAPVKKTAAAPVKGKGSKIVAKGSSKGGGGSKGGAITKISPGKGSASKPPAAPAKKGGGKGAGNWVFVPQGQSVKKIMKQSSSKVISTGGGGKKTKGKGKGKGGKLRPAGLKSSFWQNKIENESRESLGGKKYSGTIKVYNWKQAWGLIRPDNAAGLPKRVKEALAAEAEKARAAGKEDKETDLIYFRKPDINHQEGFKVTADVPVTFTLYVDEKGAGACDVSPA